MRCYFLDSLFQAFSLQQSKDIKFAKGHRLDYLERMAAHSPGRHGGARKGAGRKTADKNKKTREIAVKALQQGISPLEFILQVMRDDKAPLPLRCEMAVSAMPYCHARIGPVAPPDPSLLSMGTTIVNVISYPVGTTIDRNGAVRLPAPATNGQVIEGELAPDLTRCELTPDLGEP